MSQTVLSLIVLRSPDVLALLPFYNARGLAFEREQHGNGPIHFSCNLNGVVIEIYPPKKGRNDESFAVPMLGFRVESLEKALNALRELGVEASDEIKPSKWGRWCSVLDFDGRTIQLTEI